MKFILKFFFEGKQSLKNEWDALLNEMKNAEKTSNPGDGDVEGKSETSPGGSAAADSACGVSEISEDKVLMEKEAMSVFNENESISGD